ncbi:MAG: AAC(3) family N-acetyltransferase [Alphaproteobacteria bacterium]|nr:AAC(3) family N-acetyltransferase [Alphaproteobacteria bacterium]
MSATIESHITAKHFHKALESVLDSSDNVFAVFSGIYTFAHRFGVPAKEVVERLINVMLEVAGPSRTLVLPSFTFSFAALRKFDVVRTPSDVGILPNYAVSRPEFRRSLMPMNSYVVVGPKADELLSLTCKSAWGPDGVMAWLQSVNARICILGVPWSEACSLYHLAEEIERVPYRYFKRFTGALFENGVPLGPCEEIMFARSMVLPPIWAHDRIDRLLAREGVITPSVVPEFRLESASTRDIVEITRKMLREDPYAYIANAVEVKTWVDGRGLVEEEMGLPAEFRVPPSEIPRYGRVEK